MASVSPLIGQKILATYTVEAADSLTDLNDRARSYRELVPLTGTVADQFSTVELANVHTATVFRLTAHRLHGDSQCVRSISVWLVSVDSPSFNRFSSPAWRQCSTRT